MRNYRNAAAVLTLTLALTAPAFAGIMTTDKTSPTPTPAPAAKGIMTTDATDEVTVINDAYSGSAVDDVLAEVAATLLRSVIALF
ncbi:MAG TPA: hypothetical protein VIP46_00695 [Pyrinomonadaceae bacterium]